MAYMQLRVKITGRVQGVGFRYFVLERANALGVTGWVRNLPDRAVEVLAEGPREDLDELLRHLKAGPPGARVIDAQFQWDTSSGSYNEFRITG